MEKSINQTKKIQVKNRHTALTNTYTTYTTKP